MKKQDFALSPVRQPCTRDCPNRAFDCHTRCEAYIKFRAECDADIKKRTLERDVLGAYSDTAERLRKKRRSKT